MGERLDDDAVLVRAWQAGDEPACSALVRRHIGHVHRFFATKAPHVAEDLVQRTFAALSGARDRIDSSRSFRAYLLGVARHVLLRHFRELQRHDQRFDPLQTSVAQIQTSMSKKLAARERQEIVMAAMQALPLDQQITLELYYWDEMSVGEIAVVLEVAPGTVRARLARARARLKAELESGSGPPVEDVVATLSAGRPSGA